MSTTIPRAVNLQMSQALYERLRVLAARDHVSISAAIRQLIARATEPEA
jgi:hypothetical protein